MLVTPSSPNASAFWTHRALIPEASTACGGWTASTPTFPPALPISSQEIRKTTSSIVVKESERAAGDRVGGDDVVAVAAERQDRSGDGAHTTGGAVAGLGAFQSGDLFAEHVDGGVEVPAVQITATARAEPA